jgi:hypothetical protein
VRLFVWIWAGIALAVALALIFAPNKPPAPPSSSISYEEAPRRSERPLAADSDALTAPAAETVAEADVEATLSGRTYVVYGTVTGGDSSNGVIRARLFATRVLDEQESQAAQQEVEAARSAGDLDGYSEALERMQTQVQGYTDTRGRFALDVGGPGTYFVRAQHLGFLEATAHAVVDEAHPRAEVILRLSEGASIAGRVTEADSGKPAPGVEILSQGDLAPNSVRTDANGEYKLAGLTPGTYRITLNLRDTPYQVRGRIPTQEATIEKADEQVREVDFVVNPAGIVWGYVLGPDKQPVDRARVMLCTSDSIVSQVINSVTSQAPPITSHSEQDGYYELMGVPLNQEWQVYSIVNDFAPQLSSEFLLTDRNRNIRVDLYLLPGTTVYGQVVNSVDRSPVPNANVACIPSYAKFFSPMDTPQAVRDTRSDEHGKFIISDLPVGEYQVLAHKEGFKIATMGERISPDGFQDIKSLTVRLTPVSSGAYHVYGYVMDLQGNPVSGAKVGLAGFGMLGANMDTQERRTDAAGYFVIEGVEPGMLVLHVEAEGFAPQTVSNVLLDRENHVYLEGTARIAGRVLIRETGQPPPGYSVRVMPLSASGATGLFRMAESMDARSFDNSDGSFSLDVAAGSYRVEAAASGLTPGRLNVDVAAGQQQDGLVVYVSERGGAIQGRVRLADGSNPQGAVVHLGDASSQVHNLFAMVQQLQEGGYTVGADGAFVFENLPEGVYSVTARLQNYAHAHSGPIQVHPGRSASNIALVLGVGGTLQGYAYKDGAAESGAVVSVTGNEVSKLSTTDRNGYYVIEHLPAGTYMASKISMGGGNLMAALAPVHARIEIYEGQTTVYNFGEETGQGATLRAWTDVQLNLGEMGFAILVMPGAEDQIRNLNFTNPMEWFSSNSSIASMIMDMRPLTPDGGFTMENLPEGNYLLAIFRASPGQLLMGGADVVYEEIVEIQGTTPIELNITTQ